MAITPDRVREIFRGLETGDGAAFFEHVADDVDWTVMGTHPLAGHYLSKQACIEGTFAKLGQVLPQGAELQTDTWSSTTMKQWWSFIRLPGPRTENMRFDNYYCWVVYFKDEVIVKVRAYLDSAMVTQLFAENTIAA